MPLPKLRSEVICGDMRRELAELPASLLFDSCVTDPPYELGFMGQAWDKSGISFQPETWRLVFDSLKPGAHLLAFSSTRTQHRIACAIEDAGFEIRDTILWLYGSGFPKSLDVSKAIDKAAGASREVIGESRRHGGGSSEIFPENGSNQITAPATEAARQWQGWGTALKPSVEPVILARKPLAEDTVAENVTRHGTGAINIDACRIAIEDGDDIFEKNPHTVRRQQSNIFNPRGLGQQYEVPDGRWPANVILGCACEEEDGSHEDGCAVRMLDEQSGITSSGKVASDKLAYDGDGATGFLRGVSNSANQHGDTGGASRFFYCAKASKDDRAGGDHPTVKPLSLMRYLVRLVTPRGGLVLDPFSGTFKTGEACALEGFGFVGIELAEENCETGRARLSRAHMIPADLPRRVKKTAALPLFSE